MKIEVQPFFVAYRCKKRRREFCIAVTNFTNFTKIDFSRFRSQLVEVEKRFDHVCCSPQLVSSNWQQGPVLAEVAKTF
jgi:hypothetical protein